jgi:hypothetical protein
MTAMTMTPMTVEVITSLRGISLDVATLPCFTPCVLYCGKSSSSVSFAAKNYMEHR